MSTTTTNKNHYTAIAYTATFLGLLLVLFLFVVFFTSSKPIQDVNKVQKLQATTQLN
jgi:hypothetical protein